MENPEEDRTGLGTVQDLARLILEQAETSKKSEYPLPHPYWCEMVMTVDGKRVNIEVVVTSIDGKATGQSNYRG